MKLPQQLKEDVNNELSFIIKRMGEEPDIGKKMYYYSAVKGAFERAGRLYYDREIQVVTPIVDITYALINDRINHIKIGDATVPFSDSMLTQLIEGLVELKQAINEDKTVYPAIEKLMEVAYLSSGPGFYTRSFIDYIQSQRKSPEE